MRLRQKDGTCIATVKILRPLLMFVVFADGAHVTFPVYYVTYRKPLFPLDLRAHVSASTRAAHRGWGSGPASNSRNRSSCACATLTISTKF